MTPWLEVYKNNIYSLTGSKEACCASLTISFYPVGIKKKKSIKNKINKCKSNSLAGSR